MVVSTFWLWLDLTWLAKWFWTKGMKRDLMPRHEMSKSLELQELYLVIEKEFST